MKCLARIDYARRSAKNRVWKYKVEISYTVGKHSIYR